MADGQDHIMWPAATVSGLSECGPSVAFTLVGHYALCCLTGDGDDDKDVGGPSDPVEERAERTLTTILAQSPAIQWKWKTPTAAAVETLLMMMITT